MSDAAGSGDVGGDVDMHEAGVASPSPLAPGSIAIDALLRRVDGGSVREHVEALKTWPWAYKARLELDLAGNWVPAAAKAVVVVALLQGREAVFLEGLFTRYNTAFTIHDMWAAYEAINRTRIAKRAKKEMDRCTVRGEYAMTSETDWAKAVASREKACEVAAADLEKQRAAQRGGAVPPPPRPVTYATREARGYPSRVVDSARHQRKAGGGNGSHSAFGSPGSTRRRSVQRLTNAGRKAASDAGAAYTRAPFKARRLCDTALSRKRRLAHLDRTADDARFDGLTLVSFSGAMARRFAVWFHHVPKAVLQRALLLDPSVKWKALAKVAHANPQNMADPLFLPAVYDANERRAPDVEYALGLTHTKLQDAGLLSLYRIPMEYVLRKFPGTAGARGDAGAKPMSVPSAARTSMVEYSPLRAVITSFPAVHTPMAEALLFDRLTHRVDDVGDVPASMFLSCARYFEARNPAMYFMLLAAAERRLRRDASALCSGHRTLVLCDASAAMAPYLSAAHVVAGVLAYATAVDESARTLAGGKNLLFYSTPGAAAGAEAPPTVAAPPSFPIHSVKAAMILGAFAPRLRPAAAGNESPSSPSAVLASAIAAKGRVATLVLIVQAVPDGETDRFLDVLEKYEAAQHLHTEQAGHGQGGAAARHHDCGSGTAAGKVGSPPPPPPQQQLSKPSPRRPAPPKGAPIPASSVFGGGGCCGDAHADDDDGAFDAMLKSAGGGLRAAVAGGADDRDLPAQRRRRRGLQQIEIISFEGGAGGGAAKEKENMVRTAAFAGEVAAWGARHDVVVTATVVRARPPPPEGSGSSDGAAEKRAPAYDRTPLGVVDAVLERAGAVAAPVRAVRAVAAAVGRVLVSGPSLATIAHRLARKDIFPGTACIELVRAALRPTASAAHLHPTEAAALQDALIDAVRCGAVTGVSRRVLTAAAPNAFADAVAGDVAAWRAGAEATTALDSRMFTPEWRPAPQDVWRVFAPSPASVGGGGGSVWGPQPTPDGSTGNSRMTPSTHTPPPLALCALPDDLLKDIAARLDPAALSALSATSRRCRCVCFDAHFDAGLRGVAARAGRWASYFQTS